jgi:hypothetical protein
MKACARLIRGPLLHRVYPVARTGVVRSNVFRRSLVAPAVKSDSCGQASDSEMEATEGDDIPLMEEESAEEGIKKPDVIKYGLPPLQYAKHISFVPIPW